MKGTYRNLTQRAGQDTPMQTDPGQIPSRPASSKYSALTQTLGGNFRGDIQFDGYGTYKVHAKANPGTKLIACLANIRRNFVESLEDGHNQHAARIVLLIARLHLIQIIFLSEIKKLARRRASPILVG